jgi:tetratricopeptide (TPR) repeat protein
VFHRPTLRRLGLWLGRSRDIDATPVVETAGTASRNEPAPMPAPVVTPALDGTIALECPPNPLPGPRESHHEQGLRLVEAHRWNRAQRELERAMSTATDESAAADLASVRGVRRQLRVLQKWPSDVPAHLALGRCYFELGLGEDAEAAFRRALTLAPDEPAAPYFLALEFAFRGEWTVAEGYYARARALAPELPPFADCLGEQEIAMIGDAPER